MGNLRTAIEANYVDADGLVNPNPVLKTDINKTGNGLLYTSLYYIQLQIQNDYDIKDLNTFDSIIDSCSTVHGLLNRSPTKTDLEAADDYYGVCCTTFKGAVNTHSYGECNKFLFWAWSYDNENPNKFKFRSWFGRFPWFVAHLQFSLRLTQKPNILRRFTWGAKILLDSFSSNPNTRIINWLMLYAFKSVGKKFFICNAIVNRWNKGLLKKFPLGMKQVMGEYFGAAHPLSVYWVDIK